MLISEMYAVDEAALSEFLGFLKRKPSEAVQPAAPRPAKPMRFVVKQKNADTWVVRRDKQIFQIRRVALRGWNDHYGINQSWELFSSNNRVHGDEFQSPENAVAYLRDGGMVKPADGGAELVRRPLGAAAAEIGEVKAVQGKRLSETTDGTRADGFYWVSFSRGRVEGRPEVIELRDGKVRFTDGGRAIEKNVTFLSDRLEAPAPSSPATSTAVESRAAAGRQNAERKPAIREP